MPSTIAMMSARKDSSSTRRATMYLNPAAISRGPAGRGVPPSSGGRDGSLRTAVTAAHRAIASRR